MLLISPPSHAVSYTIPFPARSLVLLAKTTRHTQKYQTHERGSTVKMSSKPTIWDHDAHLALLQAVIAEAPPTPGEWEKILSRVEGKGYSYTSSAAL